MLFHMESDIILSAVKKPIMLIDRAKSVANIERMSCKARSNDVVLRPHFKTHQSAEVGRWFRIAGIDRIAVSSVSMARFFAANGWSDIMIAFPANLREVDEINHLAGSTNLSLTVSAKGIMPLLAERISAPVNIFLEIDVGANRTGFNPLDIENLLCAINQAATNPKLRLAGFMTHAGHTYQAQNSGEIFHIHKTGMELLNKLKKDIGDQLPNPVLSWGDTPTCVLADEYYGADELRPGNFVFYDLMQWQLGVCSLDEIAVAVAAPVVALYPSRNEMVVYAGAVHLSKEVALCPAAKPHYGIVVILDTSGRWKIPEDKVYVRRISQEHGVISASEQFMERFVPGDLVGILPVHSCLTADLLRHDSTLVIG
ncbi:MAG TPA: alanine racemase [Bacteroidales bacterium]|nr:alanine racemase [Bacteroidales bacterium]